MTLTRIIVFPFLAKHGSNKYVNLESRNLYRSAFRAFRQRQWRRRILTDSAHERDAFALGFNLHEDVGQKAQTGVKR